MTTTIGIAGMGAIGGAVAKALDEGINGYEWIAYSDLNNRPEYTQPNLSLEELASRCDLIVEALPPEVVPKLTPHVFARNKDIMMISACALLIHPEILTQKEASTSRIIVPSGAIIGIDGVSSLAQIGITSSRIITTKPPRGLKGAPYVEDNAIDLDTINTATKIFEGTALEAAKGFPANVNVAATLSLAGIGAQKTRVEIWADPSTTTNSHEIIVESAYSRISAKVENMPDPSNPKSSILAAQSMIRALKNMTGDLVIA